MTSGPRDRYRVIVCRGPECGDHRDSAKVHAAFTEAIRARGWGAAVELAWQSCFGRCRQGPNVLVRIAPKTQDKFLFAPAPLGAAANAALYNGVTPAEVGRILDEHVAAGRIVRDLIKRPEYGAVTGETLRSQGVPGKGDGES